MWNILQQPASTFGVIAFQRIVGQCFHNHWGGTDAVLAVRRRVVAPVPKRDIYSIMYILLFDRKSGQYVSKHRHFIMVWYVKGISAKYWASKRAISVFFAIIRQQQKTRFLHVHLSAWPCSETSRSLFRNVLVININAMKGTMIVVVYNV